MTGIRLIIFMFWCSMYFNETSAQSTDSNALMTVENNLQTNLIKKDSKLYFFSEIHIDNLSDYYKQSSLNIVHKKSASLYSALYSYLYDSCNVRTFIFEAPISYEYYFNNFLNSGDTTWLNIIENYKNVKSQLFVLRDLNSISNDINIFCIDRDYIHTTRTMIDALFLLIMHEVTKTELKDAITLDSDENYYYFDSLLSEVGARKPEYYNTVKLYFNFKYLYTPKCNKLLYDEMYKITIDTNIQNNYRRMLGDKFVYFNRIREDFILFYRNKNKTTEDFTNRESFMSEQLMKIYSQESLFSYYLLVGYEHHYDINQNFTPLYKLILGYGLNETIISQGIIYYEQFKYMYPTKLTEMLNNYEVQASTSIIMLPNEMQPSYVIRIK